MAHIKIVPGLALVLSGGAYKVMFQIAFLWFLEKIGVSPEKIYAISGGVPNALAFMLGKAGRLLLVWFEIEPSELYSVSWFSFLVKPLVRGKKPGFGAPGILKNELLTKIIDREVDFAAVLRDPRELWVGVEDYTSGLVKWVSNHDPGMTPERFRTFVLASMRIPIFFTPIDEGEAQLADAGLMTNIPIGEAIRGGARTILALNALPRKLPEIKRLDTWPEMEVRNSDVAHIKEGERHRQAIEETNAHIKGVAEIKAKLCAECRERVTPDLDVLPRSNKRHIDFYPINVPTNLSIFKKEGSYGSPTAKARFELLGAGLEGVMLQLIPFISKAGLFDETDRETVDSFETEFTARVPADYAEALRK